MNKDVSLNFGGCKGVACGSGALIGGGFIDHIPEFSGGRIDFGGCGPEFGFGCRIDYGAV